MVHISEVSLCFDLDGTIVDTAPDLVRVLNDVIAEEGLPETSFNAARNQVGFGAKKLIIGACEREGHPISDARVDELWKLFLQKYAQDICVLSKPFPGVIETLRGLKDRGASLSVCTNKPGYLARPLIKELKMERFFDRTVGSQDLVKNKPNAEHIFAAAGHRKSDRIVMMGDSLPDVLAAKNARVPSVLFTYGYAGTPMARLRADYVLRRFWELPNALSQIGIRF